MPDYDADANAAELCRDTAHVIQADCLSLTSLRLVLAERLRQVTAEGYTAAHDDAHDRRELLDAALCYADPYHARPGNPPPALWPWGATAWKPTDPVRNLVKAAALLCAEIDRLVREREGKS